MHTGGIPRKPQHRCCRVRLIFHRLLSPQKDPYSRLLPDVQCQCENQAIWWGCFRSSLGSKPRYCCLPGRSCSPSCPVIPGSGPRPPSLPCSGREYGSWHAGERWNLLYNPGSFGAKFKFLAFYFKYSKYFLLQNQPRSPQPFRYPSRIGDNHHANAAAQGCKAIGKFGNHSTRNNAIGL